MWTRSVFAGNRNVSSHHARKASADGQPESRSAESARHRSVRLSERFEKPRNLLLCHTYTGVTDLKRDKPIRIAPRFQAHFSVRCEFAGIAHQVEKALAHLASGPPRISPSPGSIDTEMRLLFFPPSGVITSTTSFTSGSIGKVSM